MLAAGSQRLQVGNACWLHIGVAYLAGWCMSKYRPEMTESCIGTIPITDPDIIQNVTEIGVEPASCWNTKQSTKGQGSQKAMTHGPAAVHITVSNAYNDCRQLILEVVTI